MEFPFPTCNIAWRRDFLDLDSVEIAALFFAAILCGTIWIPWYRGLISVNRLRGRSGARIVLSLVPPLCLLGFALALKAEGATTVRDDPLYFAFYTFVAAGWISASTAVFTFLGIGARDDALERNNPSALWAVSGALFGVTACFAGANIGNGPGIEAVVFSAALSSVLFFAIWFGLNLFTQISDAITIDRDESAGIRLAGLLVSVGLVSGWSVAGDWISAQATLRDCAVSSWPAILLAAIAVVLERILGGTSRSQSKLLSGLNSMIYISLAIIWIIVRGLHT